MNTRDTEYIQQSGKYRLLKQLNYDQIVPFVFENIRKKTISARFYFSFNGLTLILILYFLIPGTLSYPLFFKHFFVQFLSGLMMGSILIIPFHEGFHALAYKLVGAPKIHFGADMRQMIFYVSADHYAIGRRSFYFVALAPFVMINLAGIALYLLGNNIPMHTLLFSLLFHNIMCIGDFAMLSFFQMHRGKELVTFDDLKGRISYIYEKMEK